MPGRSYSSPSYRYGFNGKEKDDDVKGTGNSIDFGFRIQDTRLGRFLSVDPLNKNYPSTSPFDFATNNPLRFIDILGLGPKDRIIIGKGFLGTPYKQESGTLRTAKTKEALEYFDCAENICRVMDADKITAKVEWLNAPALLNFYQKSDKFVKHDIPQAGDLGVWSEHAFLVESYDPDTKKVTVLHSTHYTWTDKSGKTTSVASTVEETYPLSYFTKKGAQYFKPKEETPDVLDPKTYKTGQVKPTSSNTTSNPNPTSATIPAAAQSAASQTNTTTTNTTEHAGN